jgi:hypothetical protein
LGRVVVRFGVATVVRDVCTPDRRRPNRQAEPAARRAAATRSGRRRRFWASQPLQGEKAVRDRDQGHVVVPAGPAAPLEMVQPKAAFELAVILLHSPAQPGQTDQFHQRGAGRWQVGRRRPSRRAGLAARRAAATTSGRRRRSRAAQALQGEEPVGDRNQGHVMMMMMMTPGARIAL